MRHRARRIGLLEARSQAREGRPCVIVHQYKGETVADALAAAGHERGALDGS